MPLPHPRTTVSLALCLASPLLLTQPSWAQSTSGPEQPIPTQTTSTQTPQQRLQSLIDQEDFAAADTLAKELLPKYEGQPQFDIRFAITAIEMGELETGVFTLERVLLVEPNNQSAKLELARAYFMQNRYDQARLLFQQVSEANPPEAVQARIQFFLTAMDNRPQFPETEFNHSITFKTGYDDNINTGPSDQPVFVVLSGDALGRGDHFDQVTVNSTIDHRYNRDNSIFVNLEADFRRYHDESEQDFKSASVSGGHRWVVDDQAFQLNLFMQKYDLDHKDYRDLIGVGGSWSLELNNRLILRTYANASQLTYDQSPYRDSTQLTLGGSLFYLPEAAWNPMFFGGVFTARERPLEAGLLANGEVDSKAYGANLGVQLSPTEKLTLTFSMLYQQKDYQGEDWIYSIRRDDTFTAYDFAVEWELIENWELLAGYQYQDNKSNIEIQQYDRALSYLGIRYRF